MYKVKKISRDAVCGFTEKRLLNGFIFRELILGALLVTVTPLAHYHTGKYLKIALVYGLLVLAVELLRGRFRGAFSDKSELLPVLFIASYAVTLLLNGRAELYRNAGQFVWLAAFFLLLYLSPSGRSREEAEREMIFSARLVTGLSFIYAFLSFTMYMIDYSRLVPLSCPEDYVVWGFYANRLFGLYNPNIGALLNSLSVILSVFLFLKRKKDSAFEPAVLFINVLLQLWCLILTASRTSFAGFTLVLAAGAFLIGLKRLKPIELRNNRKIAPWLSAVGLSLAVTLLFLLFCGFTRVCLSYMPRLLGSETEACVMLKAEAASKPVQVTMLSAESKEAPVEINPERPLLSGRDKIWSCAIRCFKEKPFFGHTNEGSVDRVCEILYESPAAADRYSAVKLGGMHNIYLSILVSSGLCGFVPLLLFFILKAFSALKALLLAEKTDTELLFSFLIFAFFLITGFAESQILYRVGFFNALFWTFSGYASAFVKKPPCETPPEEKQ